MCFGLREEQSRSNPPGLVISRVLCLSVCMSPVAPPPTLHLLQSSITLVHWCVNITSEQLWEEETKAGRMGDRRNENWKCKQGRVVTPPIFFWPEIKSIRFSNLSDFKWSCPYVHFGSWRWINKRCISLRGDLEVVHAGPVSVLSDIGAIVTLIKFLQNVCCEPQSGLWCRIFVIYKQLICSVVCFEAVFSSNTSDLF